MKALVIINFVKAGIPPKCTFYEVSLNLSEFLLFWAHFSTKLDPEDLPFLQKLNRINFRKISDNVNQSIIFAILLQFHRECFGKFWPPLKLILGTNSHRQRSFLINIVTIHEEKSWMRNGCYAYPRGRKHASIKLWRFIFVFYGTFFLKHFKRRFK